jgi:hypothetical protein
MKKLCSVILIEKIFISTLVILSLLTIPLPSIVHACGEEDQTISAERAVSIKFRFEDYKSAEDAERKLLELFPIGSNANLLINKMRSMNAEYLFYNGIVSFEYSIQETLTSGYLWRVELSIKNDRIEKIKVRKHHHFI